VRGGPDEADDARFDIGQEDVLLSLLKRWISSMKRMVGWPVLARRLAAPRARDACRRRWDSTPLSRSKRFFVRAAIDLRERGFAVPGGHRE